jgi:DNA polymerase
VIVKADAAQIEARIVAWLARQDDLVEQFRNGEDIYSDFASRIFGRTITRADEDERFIGKNAILGLGFSMGAEKFRKQLAEKSFTQIGKSIILPIETADRIVRLYRQRYRNIPLAWDRCSQGIREMVEPRTFLTGANRASYLDSQWGPIAFQYQAIMLPNGLRLEYPNLRFDPGAGQWMYTYGKQPRKLFPGKVFENIVQALARIITMSAAVQMQKYFPLVHQIHDDLVYIVPEKHAKEFANRLVNVMSTEKDWWKGLPLAAESGMGPSYGEAK